MTIVRGPRPLAIRVFAAAFLAAALLRLVRGLTDLPLAELVYAIHLPWIYLFAAPFARWLVLGFGALRLAFLDPAALTGALLVAVAMASLLTPQAARWFARTRTPDEIDPAIFE
jgi:hypothetical protein